jgi:hypothetical protein
MPLQSNGPAPYTTVNSVTTVLDANRNRGLASPVTQDTLVRLGVPESLARRTLQSLALLELIGDEGAVTETLVAFARARGEEEYRSLLAEWLRSVYADVLTYVDPATDGTSRIAEALRTYEPAGQRNAMAVLMVGLWRYAGMATAEPAKASGTQTIVRPKSTDGNKSTSRSRVGGSRPASSGASASQQSFGVALDGELPPGLVGLLHQIPRGGAAWTTAQRDAFLEAFTAVLNYSISVNDTPSSTKAVEEGDP